MQTCSKSRVITGRTFTYNDPPQDSQTDCEDWRQLWDSLVLQDNNSLGMAESEKEELIRDLLGGHKIGGDVSLDNG